MANNRPPKLTLIEDKIWIIIEPTGMAQYDFSFEDFFVCQHPYQLESEITAIARMGATNDYPKRFNKLKEWGINLIHTPDEYDLTSYLPKWYPLIYDLTPKSVWYDELPTAQDIEKDFNWPVFINGERQTSKHSLNKPIIESPKHFDELIDMWKKDRILHGQKMVCREFIPLKPVMKEVSDLFPKSYEFRTFWWDKTCVGIGPNWFSENYKLESKHHHEIIKIGSKVVERLNVTFLVIDIALTLNDQWIVIECNDAQDSGYAGVNPRDLWYKVLNTFQS